MTERDTLTARVEQIMKLALPPIIDEAREIFIATLIRDLEADRQAKDAEIHELRIGGKSVGTCDACTLDLRANHRVVLNNEDSGQWHSWCYWRKRLTEAEADNHRLREYVQHKADCSYLKWSCCDNREFFCDHSGRRGTCTCGLTALLKGQTDAR